MCCKQSAGLPFITVNSVSAGMTHPSVNSALCGQHGGTLSIGSYKDTTHDLIASWCDNKIRSKSHRSLLYAHWLRLSPVYKTDILLTPLSTLWLIFGSTLMETQQTENIDLLAFYKYSNSGFLTCGLCRSSSCCFRRSRSFSICWSLIWLWLLGGSCPPCFTGALCVILCWFMAVEREE